MFVQNVIFQIECILWNIRLKSAGQWTDCRRSVEMPSEEETAVNSHFDTESYLTLDLPLPFTLNRPQHIETVQRLAA